MVVARVHAAFDRPVPLVVSYPRMGAVPQVHVIENRRNLGRIEDMLAAAQVAYRERAVTHNHEQGRRKGERQDKLLNHPFDRGVTIAGQTACVDAEGRRAPAHLEESFKPLEVETLMHEEGSSGKSAEEALFQVPCPSLCQPVGNRL